MIVGIDASNIRAGGGLTHLRCLLASQGPLPFKIVVWGGKATLDRLIERPNLEKIHVALLDGPLPVRVVWQQTNLPLCLRKHDCNVLFSPGGTAPSRSGVPTVVMSQNLLPFEPEEARRFGHSLMQYKLKILHLCQSRSFQKAEGVIFLTRYAHDKVLGSLPTRPSRVRIIPHGIEDRFFAEPRPVKMSFSNSDPFRVVYVSIVNAYKHQWNVAEAAAILRRRGIPLEVDFVGPGSGPQLKKLTAVIKRVDPQQEFLHYRGEMPFESLHCTYRQADAFVFASSCENLPNILLEAMASGLPVASSNRGPMPEIVGEAGILFDPESPDDIADGILDLFEHPEKRQMLAQLGYRKAFSYSWEDCARETFRFIAEIAKCDRP